MAVGQLVNQFTDASGKITVAVFSLKSGSDQSHYHDFACEAPSDMVVVGGGAEAVEQPAGALLTASYPNGDLTAWLASSKDHQAPQPHRITCYSIGLKVAGMSRDELMKNIHIAVQNSGSGNHPECSASVPGGYVLISGGFKVEWTGDGNLGTASFPRLILLGRHAPKTTTSARRLISRPTPSGSSRTFQLALSIIRSTNRTPPRPHILLR